MQGFHGLCFKIKCTRVAGFEFVVGNLPLAGAPTKGWVSAPVTSLPMYPLAGAPTKGWVSAPVR